jgi:hypothetical protein
MPKRYKITQVSCTPEELEDALNEMSKKGLNVISLVADPSTRPSMPFWTYVILTENIYG